MPFVSSILEDDMKTVASYRTFASSIHSSHSDIGLSGNGHGHGSAEDGAAPVPEAGGLALRTIQVCVCVCVCVVLRGFCSDDTKRVDFISVCLRIILL